MRAESPITVVGIGADGWAGLSEQARAEITGADVLFGGPRQLDLVPSADAEKVSWPSPLLPALDSLVTTRSGQRICVLASGDPMLSGIGTTLVRRFGADRVRVLPALSSVTLARARMGWSAEETEVVSVVGRGVHRVARAFAPGRRILVLSEGANTPAELAEILVTAGYAASPLTVLEELGGPEEQVVSGTAGDWAHSPGSALNVVAVECVPDPGTTPLPLVGLPDDAFEHDGQLTKRDLRASALARLAPQPGQLLWDVGAGAGSVAIEWSRAHPANRAVAVERSADRAERIARNAARLGVPEVKVAQGTAPSVLDGLSTPDAVFIGGGLSADGVLDFCWDALRAGGRLVAHGVTLESEQVLVSAFSARGGDLVRLAVEHAAPLGGFTGWTPARTVTQWSVEKK
jgi:precorrin-6Y C5,15-methyltransferase (decarboxylating)